MSDNQDLRMTRQRRIILEKLKKTEAHLSADEVHELVRKKMPRISLATVYRNLEILNKHGLINKLESAGSKKRYDAKTGEHHHVRCLRCGRVDDLREGPLIKLDNAPDRAGGYEIRGYRIEFQGICKSCREKEKPARMLMDEKRKEK